MSGATQEGGAGGGQSRTLPEDATVDVSGSAPRAAVSAEVAIDAHVGRYAVLEELGRGAMGRVVRAYDPKLQREVALKEVHDRGLGKEGLMRLVTEARAMAKLSHPNVVGVYDVEERPDGSYVLVMEYVPGTDLRAWLRAEERPWSEVLERFHRAGLGLAAAHAAGLLHRDFKPANVLVGHGGEVKVGDFGIAKVEEGAESSSRSSWDRLPTDDLTHAGTVMGTPRYMAPEQHRAEAMGPAADQYAFCVALWEGLCGSPPFSGSGGYEQLVADKHYGPPSWPDARVPRPVAAAIVRGLSPDPEERWPSMAALLDALSWDPGQRRRRWSMVAVGGLALVGLIVGWGAWAESRAARCTGAREQLAVAWGDARRAEVEAAILGIDASYAAGVWARTSEALDGYTEGWVASHTEACEATAIRGEQSAELLDLRMACLHRARRDLEAVTAELAGADAQVVRKAHRLVDELPALVQCDDVEALRLGVAPPSEAERAAVEEVEALLAEVRARIAAGRFDAAKLTLDTAVRSAESLEYGPLATRVASTEGRLLSELGDYDGAEAALGRALEHGARWWQRREMAEAAISLVGVIATWKLDAERALQYRELARGLVHDDPEGQADLAHSVASALQAAGDLKGAETHERRALELRLEILGPDHPAVAEALNNLANTLADQGRLEDADGMYQRALETWAAALGPEHPALAIVHHNLGLIYEELGDFSRAEAALRRASTLWERALGPDHPEVARGLASLGATLTKQGRFEEAETIQRRALEIREATLEPDHRDIAYSLSNLAEIYIAQGYYEEGVVFLKRSLELQERRLGPDHLEVAQAKGNVGNVLAFTGELDEAERMIRESLAVLDRELGPDHADVGTMRGGLGALFTMRGDNDAAVVELRASLAVLEAAIGSDNPSLGTTLHNLGAVLDEQGLHAEAESQQRRALALWEPALGTDHPLVASARHHLGLAILGQGRATEALSWVEDAWERRRQEDTPPESRAETAFLLARVLLESGGDRRRARRLATTARELYAQLGESHEEQGAEVARWLDELR